MKFSRAFKLSLAILFPLTLGWKWVAIPSDPSRVRFAIVEFLEQQQFKIVSANENLLNIPIIKAAAKDCRLFVGNISPYGIDNELIEHYGTATDIRFFVFRGTTYSQQPTLLTAVDYLWFKFFRDLGLISTVPPVLAVVSSSCNAGELPWGELRF